MSDGGIAVVGMACMFPGARDLGAFWRNVAGGVDAITDVPAGRWDPLYYDPGSDAPDRFYCRRGGFIDDLAEFDPLAFGIMPSAAAGAEPDQLLTLDAATAALADAGYDSRPFERETTGVILGRGGYVGPGQTRLIQRVRGAQELVEALRSLVPGLAEGEVAAVKAEFESRLAAYGPDTAIGLVPNLAASRVANRLDLGGPAYTVDAACASSLVAVGQACRDLRDGLADMVVAGGVHVGNGEAFWSVFCQLGALSRSEQIRPFDRRADGLLIGEGVGVVVLKRLDDALRDDDRIYAVIRGVGVSSDGRSATLMNPAVDGQLAALDRAWRAAGLDPASVGLVEAHGTGTPAGDAAELETLARFFGPPGPEGRRAGLGSVKSMIGHAMPAAGAAGLIKAVLALHHAVLPPTLHCEEPSEAVDRTRFRLLQRAEEWEGARRAGVNAFGFGGINAHVVLDAQPAPARRRPASHGAPEEEQLLVLAASSREELLDALADRRPGGDGAWRLAVAHPTDERLEQARAAVESGARRHGRDGIAFSPGDPMLGDGSIAFLFPGVEATFSPRVEGIAEQLGLEPLRGLERDDIEGRGVAVFEVARLLQRALLACGIEPDVIAGHSLGEWSGMIAAGMLGDEHADSVIASLAPGSLEIPGFVFAAVGCGRERAQAAIDGLPDVSVSHDNCPHQSILCGPEREVEVAVERLRGDRVLAQILPMPRGGFHSPLFAAYAGPFRAHFAAQPVSPATIPFWSATTCEPYPDDPELIRELAVRHLLEPVRFRELLLRLHAHGVRAFVQVGTGNLIGFVDDTLQGLPHLTVASTVAQRTGLAQLRRAAATLWVEGAAVQLERLGIPLGATEGRRMRLSLGVPLVRLERTLAAPPAAALPGEAELGEPVLAAFSASMQELREAQEAVALAYASAGARRPAGPPAVPPPPAELVETLRLDLATWPDVIDHCFYRQPDGWSNLADRYPVVPMTMSITLALDAARRLTGREPVAVEHVRALRWLVIEPPVDVTLRARHDGAERVRVGLDGHFEAVVRVGDGHPEPPAPQLGPPAGARTAPISARDVYEQHWMFHGPAYHGIVGLDHYGDDGLSGTVEALAAPGALLDAAGQMTGVWISLAHAVDRMALPVRVERIELFGPLPPVGERLRCTVRMRSVGSQAVTADMELVHHERVWARIVGWQDWRFPTDERLWSVFTFPERNLACDAAADGYVHLHAGPRLARLRDQLARRFLTSAERDEHEAAAPGRRAQWLNGRVAAKDAVRRVLFEHGADAVFPIEVGIRSEPSGRPVVEGCLGADVRVSIAHTGDHAFALAAVGRDPGIDAEPVEPRSDGFAAFACGPAELALLPEGDRDEWLTRFWCAKEALGKARGTGLAGRPRALAVTAVDGERVQVEGAWVDTRLRDGLVVAWIVR